MSGHIKPHVLVAAIDFGTTYSGYAFSFVHDFKKDPLKISMWEKWNSGTMMSRKTPTVLYYDPVSKIELFGYEAENKYIDVIQDKDKTIFKRCFYFSLFKMELYGHKKICEDMKIKDISGKEMKALDVFTKSLRWLKQHLFDCLSTRGQEVDESEVRWVVTVPAIWNDAAKQFMRLAGQAAGMSDDRLIIALEPEAASIFCQYVPIEKHVFQDGVIFSELDTDRRFMVADLGGGTADITVHQKLPDNYLKELLSASGGNHGGSAVNDAYLQFWASIVGDEALVEFKRDFREDYMDVMREFETTKRTAATKGRAKITVKISAKLNELCKKYNKKKSVKDVAEGKYKDKLEVVQDKLRMFTDSFQELFDPTLSCILALIGENLNKKEANGVNLVILVGGFAECSLVRQAIHAAMKERNINVVVPEDPELAVLKGAVIFGHNPKIIQSRITRFTYGISAAPYFDPNIHKREFRIEMHGKHYCRDVFSTFMVKGTSVEYGHSVKKQAATVIPFQENLKFEVFSSTSINPTYTTDPDCVFLAELIVKLDNVTKHRQEVEIEYEFGMTEITMTAKAKGGSVCTTKFQLDVENK